MRLEPSSRAGRWTAGFGTGLRRRKRRAGARTSGRAGAQREKAASMLPGLVAGEFLAQASGIPRLSALAARSGASPQCREKCGVAGSQLGLCIRVLLPAGGPRQGALVPRVIAPTPLQLCRDPGRPPAVRSAPSCAQTLMAEPLAPLATHGGPPRLGETSPWGSICAPAQSELQAFLHAQRF